jgi:cysteine desulfurase
MGMATALRLAEAERNERVAHVRALRDRLFDELPRRIPGLRITGPGDLDRRVPASFSCCFEGVEGEAVLLQLDLRGISASSGSACTTASLEPSHVLLAMKVSHELARGSLRITLGTSNTMEEIDEVLTVLPDVVERLRKLAPHRARHPARTS